MAMGLRSKLNHGNSSFARAPPYLFSSVCLLALLSLAALFLLKVIFLFFKKKLFVFLTFYRTVGDPLL